jgi:large subunit ribosomal protein L9
MKVILLKDVRGVGLHGEVKNVADGYAINKLLPGKLAEPATEEKVKHIEAEAQARAAERQKEDAELDAKVVGLDGKSIELAARATEKGGLFKSITEADVAKAIRAGHSLELPESAVVLAEHIKTTGEHQVTLRSKNNKAALVLNVSASL